MNEIIIPDWSLPPNVRAVFTTRHGGSSPAPYHSFNLALHVGDRVSDVLHNRQQLRHKLGLKAEPAWLEQIHGATVHRATSSADIPRADACITTHVNLACTVLVADCAPVLLCDDDGHEVAAVHVGWRGLAAGIIARTADAFHADNRHISAWIGPCIGPRAFEVGVELRTRFTEISEDYARFFTQRDDHWSMDLSAACALALNAAGVRSVSRCRRCVYSEPQHFFSYRRDGTTGRMAALIWKESRDSTDIG